MTKYRDLRVGDVVYVVSEHRVTATDGDTATLDDTIVTTLVAVDEAEQLLLRVAYRNQ
jgi:hypothetical protein